MEPIGRRLRPNRMLLDDILAIIMTISGGYWLATSSNPVARRKIRR
ncbi:hypothetical protein SEA_YUNGMONEY_40 [Gordonia phage YungMoney]|nr:hypothetical protein SEA_YUNGMONEY_40 [Gordonia phage YungMoney]